MFTGFKNKSRFSQDGLTPKLVNAIRENVDTTRTVTAGVARSAFAMEALSDSAAHSLNAAGDELSASLESIAASLGMAETLTPAQIDAGTFAGILAGDFRGYMSQKQEFPMVSTESMGIVQPFGIADALTQRSFGLEAYDERENRNAVVYSIAYNMQSARQDDFGETLYPTLTLSADNVGFGVVVNLMSVYDGIERKVSGTFEDFAKKNIIRAVADASVLRKQQTRIIPVHRAQSAGMFVGAGVVAPHAIVLEGESINTAPLAFGKKLDLLGLSQTDTLLSAGMMDQTDTIDPAIVMQAAYVVVANDVLKFNLSNLPMSEFTYSTQNNYRVQTLNFGTTSILVNKNTKCADGSALDTLAGIVTGDLIVRLEMNLTGSINIETGETTVFGNRVAVHSIKDSSGNLLDLTAAPAAAIVAAVDAATMAGYDVVAYRTNANIRQRGQLIDVTKYTQLYNVPLRSPISKIQPINSDGQNDASDLQALVTTTRIRTNNEAVTALISASQMLSEYVDDRDTTGAGPDVLGAGRFFVRPTYHRETIAMPAVVDSISSHQRAADIQAAIVNKIRDVAYRMYRDSEYKAAADALSGGVAPVPTVIIATDPVLARYLSVEGDLRTLGGEFNVRVVSTLDSRVAGHIFITFGVFSEDRNSAPNVLNFGNMIWAPEMVLTANISRSGQISKETVVQPRYLFVNHLPVLAQLTITGIPDVLSKVAINNNPV